MTCQGVGPLKITHVLALVSLATFASVLVVSSAPPAGAARIVRIGMVANTNGTADRSFNEMAYGGVQHRGAAKLGRGIQVVSSPTPCVLRAVA